ncbi:MAG: hypothetical protein M1829_002784 [Trizodia sp. TS-e1964]|nr:MAG: hypothetical protein M1829_002784 [Trizodia sp. TS-e1964]
MSDELPSADDLPVTFHVKSSSDQKFTLTIPLSTNVADLKTKLAGSEYADVPADRQRLIYSGRVLKDHDILSTYKIKDGHTIHLVKGAASNHRQNPANQSSESSNPPTAATGVPNGMAAGTGNNPLAALTGARFAGLGGLPGVDLFGPNGGMGAPPDPERMINMLQNPQFASTMNEALQNPQVLDAMFQQSPALRGMGPQVRQMLESPELRRMLLNPEILRQMSQMSRGLGMLGPGASGNQAFPAPGATGNADSTTDETGLQNSTTQAAPEGATVPNSYALFGANMQAAGNPFANMFGFPPPSATSAASQDPLATSFPNAGVTPNQMPPYLQGLLASMAAENQGGAQPGPFNFFGGGVPSQTPAPVDTRPVAERYATQLGQLNDMGFCDFDQNIAALTRTGGNVNGAIEYLLTH